MMTLLENCHEWQLLVNRKNKGWSINSTISKKTGVQFEGDSAKNLALNHLVLP